MKRSKLIKQIALQRVDNLIFRALNVKDSFAEYNIEAARTIIKKYKLKIPFQYKILFCKKCKKFIIPGNDSTIRIGRSRIKALRITCKFCGHTYRKVLRSKRYKKEKEGTEDRKK